MGKSLIMKWVGHKAFTVKKTNKDNISVISVTKPPTKKITTRILGVNRTEVN
jgi:hypothetical protein